MVIIFATIQSQHKCSSISLFLVENHLNTFVNHETFRKYNSEYKKLVIIRDLDRLGDVFTLVTNPNAAL
jgi:hypothetical protein